MLTPGLELTREANRKIKLRLRALFKSPDPVLHTAVTRSDVQGQITEIKAIHGSGLFDEVWYTERNPDVKAFADAVTHYVSVGAGRGLQPHPLFNLSWYHDTNPALSEFGTTPLGHFVLNGEAAGASPSPLFDPDWYRSQDSSLKDVHVGLFLHFLQKGALLGLSPHPAFDPDYYREARPDVVAAGFNPLTHFIEIGALEGTDPSPFFDVRWYAAHNPDIAASGINPLIHFLRWGAAEGRPPHPHIDVRTYQSVHPSCPRDPIEAYLYLVTHENADVLTWSSFNYSKLSLRSRISESGLFTPGVYLNLNQDLPASIGNPLEHFVQYGLPEGRRFTNSEVVAQTLATMMPEIQAASSEFLAEAELASVNRKTEQLAAWFQEKRIRIGVFCSAEGNFFMHEIAELLVWGLQSFGIQSVLRDETAPRDEAFDLRVFVAPHEFFYLGEGTNWLSIAGLPNSVLYNVEQVQTPWFCRAFLTLLKAPLLLDINFQSTEILRRFDCNVVHFMPGHLPSSPYARPCEDVSDMDLLKAYDFSRERTNWMSRDSLADRPIDLLFIGSSSPRRDRALAKLVDLADKYRFMCIYKSPTAPLTLHNQRTSSTRINCAIAQRTKIVVNIHRDWVSYFEWSRIGLLGLWQGACVVSDPSLAHPIYQPGVHFLEESVRHMGELIEWLLDTQDGLDTLNATRRAGFERVRELGSMPVALAPVLNAFKDLLD